MTKTDALKLVTIIGAAFPRAGMPQATVDLYIDRLLPLDVESAQRAVLALIDEPRQFPPSIGEIRHAEAKARCGKRLTAEEAWAQVKTQVRKIGSYGSFSGDPLVAEAVRQFDWQVLCRSEHRDEPANRAHFYRIYESVERRADEGYLEITRPMLNGATTPLLGDE